MRDGLVAAHPVPDGSISQSLAGSPIQVSMPAPNPLERPLAALRRYKWIIAAMVVVFGVLGVAGSRRITPKYEARATIWIASETPDVRASTGPIRSAELLRSGAWIELF